MSTLSDDQTRLLRAAERAVGNSRRSRIRKLQHRPLKMILSKALELAPDSVDLKIRATSSTFWGANMNVVLPDRVGTAIYRYGAFDAPLTECMINLVRPGMVFLDVGAHIGYFTLLARELVGPAGSVHAFEPTPTTFELLMRNVRSLTNVSVHQVAVFSHQTDLAMNVYAARFAAFNSLFDPRLARRPRGSTIRVLAISLDDYVASHAIGPDFLKIDAESAEYAILEGAEQTLRRHRPIVTMEVGDEGVRGVPRSSALVATMVRYGYQPMEWHETGLRPHMARDSYEYANLVFVPR